MDLQQLESAARSGNAAARVELANRLLSSHRLGSAEFDRGLALLTECAERDALPEARWYLGALHLTVTALPGAHARAARWLALAAEDGLPQAADRLADLCLQGLGTEPDADRALALQRDLADRGYQVAAWMTGYLLTQQGDAAGAASAFARCWALGHPEGYYSLGLRFALGAGVAPDPAFARALLIRADDAGLPDARAAADEYAPRERYGREAKRWYDRLKACHRAAQPLFARLAGADQPQPGVHPLVKQLEAHFAALDHPAVGLDGGGRLRVAPGGVGDLAARPGAWDWPSRSPRVAVSRAFATREECAHLITMIRPHMADPKAYRRGHAYGDLEYFTGEGCPVGPMEADAVIRLLERRIAGMTDHDITALEPCSIVHYGRAQEYRPHTDFFTAEQLRINRERYADTGGQRIATFLLYLQPPEAGGETRYEDADLTLRGEVGLGMLHYNVTGDGEPDPRSTHVGLPVERGEKWLWRSALREHPLIPAS